MKNILSTLLVSCSIFAISACSTGTIGTRNNTLQSKKSIVAIVNGAAITENAVNTLKTETAIYNKRIKVTREQIIKELINRELLYQQAIKHKLDQQSIVIDRIEAAKRNILFQSEMQNYMAKVKISDIELQAEYERQSAKIASDLIEYKASHILIKTEDQAKNIISLLNKGKQFHKLGKQFSTDPSAEKGGKLGWFGAKQMVPEFSNAIKLLKNGEYTRNPVKTAHGWHVILREESRKKPAPALATVADALKTRLKRIKLQKYMEELKQNSVIILRPDNK